jgi:hypothetical protein
MPEITVPPDVKKIVRLFFAFDSEEFCLDRPYEEDKDDQYNCDTALNTLIKSMQDNTVVPALHLIKTTGAPIPEGEDIKTDHVLINLGNLPYIKVINIVVYRLDQEGPKE